MPRGGFRVGTPGQNYANRTDLNPAVPAQPLPVTVGPSQQYGQATTLAQAQKAVPTASAPLPTAPPPSPSPLPSAPDQSAPQAPPAPLPGAHGDFARPTELPAEHVMTGVPQGPGAGPEVLPGPTAPQVSTVGSLFGRLVSQPGAPADLQALYRLMGSRG